MSVVIVLLLGNVRAIWPELGLHERVVAPDVGIALNIQYQ